MERDKLPRWQQPCLGSLCWTAGSVSSTPAAGPYHLYPPAGPLPTHSLGRRKSQSFPSLSWKNRETWEMTVWSGRGGVKMNCDERGKKPQKNSCSLERGLCNCFGCHGDVIREVPPGTKEADWDTSVKLEMHHCLKGYQKTNMNHCKPKQNSNHDLICPLKTHQTLQYKSTCLPLQPEILEIVDRYKKN